MNGILNINKAKNMTSFDVVAIVRRLMKTKKVGHTGTLDPDATGVLPICIGRATRVCELLLDADKAYTAEVILGASTDTDDAGGTVLETCPRRVTREEVCAVLPDFLGQIEQIPPMYSAVKINGKKLYELARKGMEVERKKRSVTIHGIRLLSFDEEKQRFTIEVSCSKGTYIRALCRDIGQALGTLAHMGRLVRTKSGMFSLEDTISIEALKAACEKGEAEQYVLPTDTVFLHLAAYTLPPQLERRVRCGGELLACQLDGAVKGGEKYRLYGASGEFLAIYESVQGEQRQDFILKCVKNFFEV